LKIVIPEGALDETKEIEIKKVKMKGAVGSAFQISPDIKFKIPAEISIKYENNSNINIKTQQKIKEEEFLRIAFYDNNGKTWVALESHLDGQRVFAKTDHLSTWAIVSDMLFPDPSSSSSSSSSYEPPTGEVPPLKVEEFSVQNFRMSSRFSQKSESELSYEEFSIGNFASILRVDEEGNVWFAEHGFLNQYATYIGKLDTRTGQVKLWWLPAGSWVSDIEVKGRDVWIVLRLGPDLVRFSMDTETFRYFRVPSYIGSWPYEIDFDGEGNIWMTVTVGRAVAKFDVRQESFVFYFRIPVGWWTAGVKVDGNKVWVTETYSCVGPFIYYVNEGRLKQLYPSERFCPGTFYILEGKAVGGMGGDRLGILDEEGVLDVHGIGLEFSGWMGIRREDRSVWAGGNNYVFWYSVGERAIKGRANFERGAGVIAVEVDFEGNAWAILRNVKKVVKIKAKPVVLGCDKTCGGGDEQTPLVHIGHNLHVNLVSGNLYEVFPLFEFDSDSLGLQVSLIYNSLDESSSSLGPRWRTNWDIKIIPKGEDLILIWEDGKRIIYKKVSQGTWISDERTAFKSIPKITFDGSNYILHQRGGTIRKFDNEGKIILIEDRRGNKWNFIYEGNLLVKIVDPVGRNIEFKYSDGKLKLIRDPIGNEWEFSYDESGRFASIKDPLGGTTHYIYDNMNRMIEKKDALGVPLRIVYDEKGRVAKSIDMKGHELSIAYSGNTVILTSRRGITQRIEVDSNLNVIKLQSDQLGNTYKFEYDERGNLIKQITPSGLKFEYKYDDEGNLVQIKEPTGATKSYKYNQSGDIVEYKNEAGGIWRYEYDEKGNLIKEIDPVGREKKFFYSALGNLTATIDKLGRVWRYSYDEYGHLKEEIDPLGNVRKYSYDILGRLISQTSPRGYTVTYEYDALGRLIKFTDQLGNSFIRVYNSRGEVIYKEDLHEGRLRLFYDYNMNLTAVVDELERIGYMNYDPDGNLIEKIDFGGGRWVFFYNESNLPVKAVDPQGGEWNFEYNGDGKRIREILPSGAETKVILDEAGRIAKVEFYDGVILTRTYNIMGLIVEESINGLVTQYEYDLAGNPVKVVRQDGSIIFYDFTGRVTATSDPVGNVTLYQYDFLGRLIKEVNPDGGIYEYSYDSEGNLISKKDPLGNITRYEYDALGRVIKIIDPKGAETSFTYDPKGNVTSITDPLGRKTLYYYDALGNVTAVVDPSERVTRYIYDSAGNVIAILDPDGRWVSFKYDTLGRVIEKNIGGRIWKYKYDIGGNLISVIDPLGNETKYTYDIYGRIVSEEDPLGRVIHYKYDEFGNLIEKTYHNNIRISYKYDKFGRVIEKVYPDNTKVTYEYDRAGRLVRAKNKDIDISKIYDSMGRIRENTLKLPGFPSFTIYYEYDRLGRRTKMIDPFGGVFKYYYDKAGNLISLVNPEGREFRFEYNLAGERTKVIYPNGIVAEYSYNGCNAECKSSMRVSNITITKDGKELLLSFSYKYDGSGNVTEVEEPDKIISYFYDDANELVGVDVKHKRKEEKDYLFRYFYDLFGNRVGMKIESKDEGLPFDPNLQRTLDGFPKLKHPLEIFYLFDKANQIIYEEARRRNGSTYYKVFYEFDPVGNLSRKLAQNFEDGKVEEFLTEFIYNFENKLKKIIYQKEGEKKENSFLVSDIDSKVYRRSDSKGKVKYFIYDGENILAELDEKGNLLARYTFGLGVDEILGKIEFKKRNGKGKNGNGKGEPQKQKNEFFYHVDGTLSVRAITDERGNLVAKYDYDPFGRPLKVWGGEEARENVFLFGGREYIPEAGIYDFRARAMDPRHGRFMQKDPVLEAGGEDGKRRLIERGTSKLFWNPYVYADNNPLRYKDPFGLYIILCDTGDKRVWRATRIVDQKIFKEKCVGGGWPFGLGSCLRRISYTVTIKCARMDKCGKAFHIIDVWLKHGLVFSKSADEKTVTNCLPCPKSMSIEEVIASTILHEMVHVCCRGENTADRCERKCFCGSDEKCP
jgi:RHS repeat-associated protein